MAIRYAVANGDWSNTATWDGGTLPAAGDEIYSNNFRVNIDVATFSALYLSNGSVSSPSITAGGGFTIEQSTEYTGDLRWHNAASNTNNELFRISSSNTINVIWTGTFVWDASGTGAMTFGIFKVDNPNATVVINGTATFERPPLGQNVAALLMRQISGDLTINADLRHFGSVASHNLLNIGAVSLVGLTPLKTTINGDIIQDGTGTSTIPVLIQNISIGGLEFNLNGNIVQGSAVRAIDVPGNHTNEMTINHIGDYIVNNISTVIAGLASSATVPNLIWNWTGSINRLLPGTINILGSGVRNITTNLEFQLNTSNDLMQISTSTNIVINFWGNMTGGNVSAARAFNIAAAAGGANPGTFNIFGNLTGGNFSPTTAGRYETAPYALISNATDVIIQGSIVAIGNSSFDSPAMFVLNTTNCFIEKAITGGAPLYTNPYLGAVRFKTTKPEFSISTEDSQTITLIDITSDDYPDEGNVRAGVQYGFTNFTGNMEVATYSRVSLGTRIDDGFGERSLSAENLENILTGGTSSSLVRLRNVATSQTVSDQFNAFANPPTP